MPPIRFSTNDWSVDLDSTVSVTTNTNATSTTNSEPFDSEQIEMYNQLIRLQQEEIRTMQRGRERLFVEPEIAPFRVFGSDISQENAPPQKPTRSGKDFEKHFENKLKKDYE